MYTHCPRSCQIASVTQTHAHDTHLPHTPQMDLKYMHKAAAAAAAIATAMRSDKN